MLAPWLDTDHASLASAAAAVNWQLDPAHAASSRFAATMAGKRELDPTGPSSYTLRAKSERDYAAAPSSETAISATSVGVRPTRTPLLSSASALALAVPCEPDTIAPAWPMVLPGGAVKPAI